jgi:hypothetical protein
MREILHDLPALPLALLFIAAVLVPLVLAVWLLGLDRPAADRSDDNVLTTATRFVGGAFALLAAFVIVSLATQSSTARSAVRAEAAAADSFAREAARLPPPHGAALLEGVRTYLETVIRDEWPRMQTPGGIAESAEHAMDALFDGLLSSAVVPAGERYDSRYELAVRSLDRLEERRAQRLLTGRDSLSPVLWTALLVSAVTILVVAAVYPAGGRRGVKWVELLAIGTVVAIVLFVVFAQEHAYHGFLAVDPAPLETVLRHLRH